jgi:hypothetical protein
MLMFTVVRARELHINRQLAMQLKRVVFVGLPQAHMQDFASNVDVVDPQSGQPICAKANLENLVSAAST